MRNARPGARWSTGRIARRSQYTAYIQSDGWFRRRERWYTEHIATTGEQPACAVCDQAWTLSRGDLHHRA
jgi:hypothetical protein